MGHNMNPTCQSLTKFAFKSEWLTSQNVCFQKISCLPYHDIKHPWDDPISWSTIWTCQSPTKEIQNVFHSAHRMWPWSGGMAYSSKGCTGLKLNKELQMLSSVTLNCQVTKIVMNSGFLSVSQMSKVSRIVFAIVKMVKTCKNCLNCQKKIKTCQAGWSKFPSLTTPYSLHKQICFQRKVQWWNKWRS